MVSVERIFEYRNLPQDQFLNGDGGKQSRPSNWPSQGKIQYQNVSLKYDEKQKHKALEGVNLTIEPGEKIGIFGRTGAGKTSFLQILFRMYEPDGRILIDGIDIKTLSLFDLRDSLTIIPVKKISLFYEKRKENLESLFCGLCSKNRLCSTAHYVSIWIRRASTQTKRYGNVWRRAN